nr:hypothetical protein [Tanacetum cinerariifolium]
DALERQKLGSEYGEQDRKAAILYEYETFKATEEEQLLDTYLRYLQVINDLKKCGYKKDNYKLNYKFLNNLQPEWKQYGTLMRQTKNLIDINIDTLYNILKQNQGDVNEATGYKKKVVMFTSDPLALVAEKIKVSKRKEKVVVQLESEGSDDDEDINDLKNITALLAKAFNREKYYAKPTNNNLRTFSASSSANKKPEYEGHFSKDCKKAKGKDYNYYKTKMLLAKKDDDEQVLLAEDQAWMESSSDLDQEINKNMVFMAKMEKILSDSEESSSSAEETITEVSCYTSDSESESEYENSEYYDNSTNYGLFVDNDDDQEIFHDAIEPASFENPSYFCKAKELRPSHYDESVIGLGYTPMFLTHSNEALEIKKFKRARYNKIEFAYDYENLNASYVNEKINFLDDYFHEIINPDFEKIDSSFQQTSSLKPYVLTVILEKIIFDLEDEVVSLFEKEKEKEILEIIESLKSKGFESSENAISGSKNQSENDRQVVEKGCDNLENSKEIAPGMFRINVSQIISLVSVSKTSYASNNVENKTKRKRHVKRYSRKDLLSCNNSHHVDTRSAYACNDAMNVSFRKIPFRKKPHDSLNAHSRSNSNKSLPRTVFRWLPKMQPLAKSVAKWIPKIYLWIIDSGCLKHKTGNRALLTNFVEKFLGTVRFGNNDFAVIAGYGDIVIGSMTIKKVYYVEGLGHNLFSVGQFCDKGLEVAFQKSTCFVRNKDGVDLLTGDCLSNLYTIALNEIASNSSACLLEKAFSSQSWLWHQRLYDLNFPTINNLVKSNLVRGLPKMKFEKDHLCFACEQGKIHRKHHKSKTDFASNKPLYLLHMDLCGPMRVEFEAARTMLTFENLPLFPYAEAITTTCFTQNHLFIHKRVDKTPYELINKRKPNIKFFHVFGCRCYLLNDYDDAGKLKVKEDIRMFVGYSKESAAFRVYNKRTRKIHESVNVNFDEISEMASKQFSLKPGLSNLNKKGKSSNPTVSQVSEISKKDLEDLFQNFYDEYFDSSKITKSPTTNVETSNNEIPSHEGEVFHEVSEPFQEESFSSSLNDDVQQSLEEVMVPPTNTQSILNESVSNTKDHPLYKIIGDPKSSVRTRGQLANSCFFTCLLSSIEPAKVAEALKDANWVSAMQDELDQFARFKVWRLVPRPEGKTIIKTKWIFKNKKDESSLVIQNKARLVAVGYCQQKGIDYDETFSSVARINAIRFFLAYASRSFKWIKQYPDHVYTLDKALYGLKQAPRAWYNVLSKFLIDSGFQKGSIDTTLFIKKKVKHIMLIQIYVDDIIFGSTNPKYCTKFLELMVKHFEMSMMGEMKFFLGLQVNQFSNEIFINQSKYILDILKQFGMENYDTVLTLMVEQAKLKLDLVGKPVGHTDYRSMIGSLMYLTSNRPDIMFATCMCARYQTNPNEHHVSAIKRIFRYLKGTVNLGLWYPKDSGFDLTAYSDADHAGCHLYPKTESNMLLFLAVVLKFWGCVLN